MPAAQSLYDERVLYSVVLGNNEKATKEDSDALIQSGDITVFQLKIPVPVVEYGIGF